MNTDKYIAKESFTAPILCVVMTTWCIWAGCTEDWNILSVGGLVFFAIGMVVYIFKYVKYGRNELLIGEAGITIKDWRKNEILHWEEIEKCDIAWRTAMGHNSRWLSIKTPEGKREQFHDVRLSGKLCRNRSVRQAIEKFGGTEIFDYESSSQQNRYVANVMLFALLAVFVLVIIYSIL
ncbi:hypothetical protein [Bacteroides acidifaciens]|uniref:hypothetical protein n=1 Tax=Bacteroides acidifaciens TaxID=85831 RepID=UPI0025770BF3|nr:hypothetical protein [Bacteroides acidifaciens]